MKHGKYSRRQSISGPRNTAFNRRQAMFNGAFHQWTQQERPGDMEREQVSDLNDQLGWEKANALSQENRRIQCEQQLDEMRQQLERQKTLKEMFINRGKETRAELERLEKYSDPETLSAARIATMVRNRIRRKKKKDLQRDFEELQVAYIKSQEKFETILQAEKDDNKLLQEKLTRVTLHQEQLTAELQAERLKSSLLHEELEKFEASQHEICQAEVTSVRQQAETVQQNFVKEIEKNAVLQKQHEELHKAYTLSQELFTAQLEVHANENKCLQEELEKVTISGLKIKNYEAEVKTAREQATAFQQELERERQAHKATIADGWTVINDMKAEQDRCRQEMEQQISILQQKAFEMERYYEEQVGELKVQLNNQILLTSDLSAELEAERPPRKRSWREERSREPCEQSNVYVPDIKCLKDTQIPEDETIKTEVPIQDEPLITPAEQAEAPEERRPEATNTPSVWKRTRHFLGLRKPERWKKKKNEDKQ